MLIHKYTYIVGEKTYPQHLKYYILQIEVWFDFEVTITIKYACSMELQQNTRVLWLFAVNMQSNTK